MTTLNIFESNLWHSCKQINLEAAFSKCSASYFQQLKPDLLVETVSMEVWLRPLPKYLDISNRRFVRGVTLACGYPQWEELEEEWSTPTSRGPRNAVVLRDLEAALCGVVIQEWVGPKALHKKDTSGGRKGTWGGVWDFGPFKCAGKAASVGLCREFPEVAGAENGRTGCHFQRRNRRDKLYVYNNILYNNINMELYKALISFPIFKLYN